MKPSAPLKVVNLDASSSWEFRILGRQEVALKRRITLRGEQWVGDALGPRWMCGIIELPYGELEFQKGDKLFLLTQGKYFVVFPPFCCLKFKIKEALVLVNAVISKRPFKFLSGKSPLYIRTDMNQLPKNFQGISDSIVRAYNGHGLLLASSAHIIAERAKFAIDDDFGNPTSLGEVAKYINTTQAQMTRAFKQAFIFTPVEYRTHMRISNSIHELLYNRPICDVFQSVGFSDLSRFNKNFKKLLTVSPSQFQFKKAN